MSPQCNLVQLHSNMLSCHRHLRKVLAKQCKKRSEYKDAGWIEDELLAVTSAANVWAEAHDLPRRVTMETVRRIDRSASGHIDWASKLCLRVAESLYYGRDGETP